jgi:hypothetical protein
MSNSRLHAPSPKMQAPGRFECGMQAAKEPPLPQGQCLGVPRVIHWRGDLRGSYDLGTLQYLQCLRGLQLQAESPSKICSTRENPRYTTP